MKITVFEGDGIGPEITKSVCTILDSFHLPLKYEFFEIGQTAVDHQGVLIPEEAMDSILRNKIALKAPVTTPVGKGFRSVNVELRTRLDLYANLRPAKSLPHIASRYQDVDLLIVRENTEDLYIGVEEEISPDEVHAIKKITRKASTRIIERAFSCAAKREKKKVTCVHKANILKKSDGLFLSIFEEISKKYPQIQSNNVIVDNACMQLVLHPEQFDVMVMPNLYGDILSDLASGLIGGLGLLPSCNENDTLSIYEAVHGSAPDIAGKNIANPTALLLSACLMLDKIGYSNQATQIRSALEDCFLDPSICTPDIGGTGTTTSFTQAIVDRLK